jgi:hypothetical protein
MAVVGLLGSALLQRIHEVRGVEDALVAVRADIVSAADGLRAGSVKALDARMEEVGIQLADDDALERKRIVHAKHRAILGSLRQVAAAAIAEGADAYEATRLAFNTECAQLKDSYSETECAMDNAFSFIDAAYGEQSQEGLVFTTRLAANPIVVSFVAQHGVESYRAHNKELLVDTRKRELLREIGQ